MDNRQLALSLRYTRQISKRRSWFSSLDYSRFDSKFEDIAVRSTSWNLGFGLGF
jgi:hypothetical protein